MASGGVLRNRQQKVFVAGSGVEREQVRPLIRQLNQQFGMFAYDWTSSPEWERAEKANPVQSAMLDLEALSDADYVIWYLSHEHSHGAPFEVGGAFCKGYPVVGLLAPGVKRDDLREKIYSQMVFCVDGLFDAVMLLRKMEKLPAAMSIKNIAARRLIEAAYLIPEARPARVYANGKKQKPGALS